MSLGAWCALWVLLVGPGLQSGLLGQPVLLRFEPHEATDTSQDGEPDEPVAVAPSRRVFAVNTFAGQRTVTGFPTEPDETQVVALVLADSFLEEDWERVEGELVGLRQGLGRRARLELAIASGSGLQREGPFRTADALRRVLRAARPPTPPSQPPVDQPGVTGAASVSEELSPGADEAIATADASASDSRTPAAALAETAAAGELGARLYRQLAEAAPVLGCDWLAVLAVGRLPELDSGLALPVAAALADRMRTHRVRFSVLPLDALVPLPADLASVVTGGTATGNVAGFLEYLEQPARYVEAEWYDPAPGAGFHIHKAEVRDTQSGATWTVPSIAKRVGLRLPEPLAMRDFLRRTADLRRLVSAPSGDSRRIRSELEELQTINPADETLLRASILFHRKNEEWESLAAARHRLTEIRPKDPAVFADLGTLLVRLQRWAEAEAAFARLTQLRPADPRAIEALGRVQAHLADYDGALERFEESLSLDPNNQALWFHKADIAKRLDDTATVMEALRKGVDLPGAPHQRRAELIRLLLDAGRRAAAAEQVELGGELAVDAPEFLAAYAGFWEELGHPEDALDLWERAAELDPDSEPAAAASARIHFSQGRIGRALEIAQSAVQRFPRSVRLHLTLARSLQASHRYHDLRRALAAGLESVPGDLDLLRYRARIEDTFGAGAAAAYRALAERLVAGDDRQELDAVLERGYRVSLRHNDIPQARWFSSQTGGGRPDLPTVPAAHRAGEVGVAVPGGMRSLALFANANLRSRPGQFFQEFCRPIVYESLIKGDRKTAHEELVRRFDRYFATISNLESLRDSERGVAESRDDIAITLSVESKRGLRKARKVLELLGWRIRGSRKKGYALQPIENESGAERQDIASALAVDAVDIESALGENRDYILRLPQEIVPLALGAEIWRAELYPGKTQRGGFAEAVVRDPRIGAVYIGISQMHPDAARAVVESVGLKRLVAQFPEVLVMHGSALAVANGMASVPGGVPALGLWTKLVGARPDNPEEFFPALLKKENGRLLGYYAALGQLDAARKGFITQTPERAERFFKLYKSSPEFQHGGRGKIRESPFLELLRELPLDAAGGVDFPGGAEVWMVAKGETDASRLVRKIDRKVVPEVEDEILVRLARTRFDTTRGPRSQVAKFLAVSRLEQRRQGAMDAVTALTFAQAFGPYEAVFPYFATLTGLQSSHLETFLTFARGLKSGDVIARNHRLALFHALTEILCIAQLEGHLSAEVAADLFASLCRRLSEGRGDEAFSDGALETLEDILAAVPGPATDDDADRRLRLALGIDADGPRQDEFLEVLRLQGVPSLASLLQARDDALVLASGEGDRNARIESLDVAVREIPTVAVTKELGFREERKRLVASFETAELLRAQSQLAKAAARRRVRQPEMERRARALRAGLLPHVVTALTGVIYAYYLRPDDLPVAEDPLFLRKHEFADLGKQFQDNFFPATNLKGISEDTGSYIAGGFAGMAQAAGHVAQFSLRTRDPEAHALARMQLGSLRASRWHEVREIEMRRFVLTTLLGREWIVAAARDAAARSELAEAVAGLLSVNRTQELFTALGAGNWPTVWSALSLSDLYQLGRGARIPDSPVAAALAALPGDAATDRRMDVLGAIRPHAYTDIRPRLWTDPPYEVYERYLLDGMIAERMAELKLYLIREADAAGMPTAQLARLAEPVARSVLSALEMGDFWDWRSVTQAFEELTGPNLREVRSR